MGTSPEIISEVDILIQSLIGKGYDLVYGGGKDGIMGHIADKFLAADQQVIGIRPEKLIADEPPCEDLTELIVVKDMYERKALMIEQSDIFIGLPGGIGTLDEVLEVFTHVKIGYIDKFCAVLNVDGFYKGLDAMLDQMVTDGFLKFEEKALLTFASNAQELMNELPTSNE